MFPAIRLPVFTQTNHSVCVCICLCFIRFAVFYTINMWYVSSLWFSKARFWIFQSIEFVMDDPYAYSEPVYLFITDDNTYIHIITWKYIWDLKTSNKTQSNNCVWLRLIMWKNMDHTVIVSAALTVLIMTFLILIFSFALTLSTVDNGHSGLNAVRGNMNPKRTPCQLLIIQCTRSNSIRCDNIRIARYVMTELFNRIAKRHGKQSYK